MTFAEKLVRLRKIKKLTQDELACAVGVSRQAVYKWESAQSYPEVAKLLEIKMLFSISLDDLLDDSFDIPLPEKKRKRRKKKEAVEEVVYVDEDGNEIELEDGAEYEEVVYVDENGNEVNDDEE
ncbi:MAG: helix-turn-helix transcriptional regulator [Clostridia bacterium]|nr:helix-turn-helix transcriptional regulator [Clostridia bacterium]MBQ2738055.1 helix-turn-helix transcriptional regulator [Clostridia bacterium]MBQ8290541.1 helix-turn-helix transcriptional regulator [Clostridia bacterium]